MKNLGKAYADVDAYALMNGNVDIGKYAENYRPVLAVISSVGIDSHGQPHNINADTAATKIAAALNAECLVFMSNIDGVMKDPKDKDSLLHKLTVVETEALKKDGTINGGMIPKVDACTDAIKDGVKKVFIINGEVPHALLIELLTNEGLGTMFVE